MKLEPFFEKFDQLADAPDAVVKMRGLLIHFAVSGKLARNDPVEKPVAISLSGPPPDEAGLPSNWRCGLLGDAFTLEYGDNLPAPKRTETGEYPVYGSNGIVGTHDTYLTKEPAIIVGRKGSAGALNIADGPSWTTDVAYFVRPPKDLDLRFTCYLFSTLHLDELGKGIKPGLSRKKAYALPIALPPLAEQKRIVAKVDELMALCDRLEAQQQERETRHAALARASLARFSDAPTVSNLKSLFHESFSIPPGDLRKSILTLAVQGKLVPQDPNEGDASPLVKKLLHWKTEHGQKKSIDLGKRKTGVSDLPASWEWLPASNALKYKQGLQIPREQQSHSPQTGWVRYLRIIDFRHDNDLRFIKPSKQDVYCKPNDIVMVRYGSAGEIVGGKSGIYHNNMFRIDFDKTALDSGYLKIFLCTDDVHRTLLGRSTSITMSQVNHSAVNKLLIPLPPFAEQRRIVAKVEQLMALVDALETQLAASRDKGQKLLEAIVSELTLTS